MKKQILAVAITAATFAASTNAAEVFNNGTSTLTIGGHITANLNGSDEGDTTVGTNSPRINLGATQDLGNGFTADVKGEWQLNMLEGGDETFTTRLGYLGLTHADLGRVVAGTQWAPYYDVAGATDLPIAFANDFIYDNHGVVGTGRADKMLSYRNIYTVGQADVNLGFGFQGANGDAEERYQVAASVDFMGANLGFAMTTGDIAGETTESQIVSGSYGQYGKGIYVAAAYAQNENINTDGMGGVFAESDALELLAAYGLPNGLNLSVNYELVDGEDAMGMKETGREEVALQAEYTINPSFVAFAGYQFDLNDDNNRSTDDKWAMGVRFYL
ncbi:porin [Vibrio parahaemolyticus]|nr:porin [Vibrio parahaemolyticus]